MLTAVIRKKVDIFTQTQDLPNTQDTNRSNIEFRLNQIEAELENSKKYNIKETAALSIITYGVCSSIFLAIGNDSPLLNAFIPTTGFVISTFVKDKIFNLFQRAKNCLNCFRSSNKQESDIEQIV
ncbi:MAG: hypothetical protein K940chlam1_00442 [Candidatus Anoxychlamydiales bacterium]|nr:hypothetical protein [Candidatus Anoxychlamydiales bacterium]NGX35743.1 hypothetical protein [Candidatus Anoxychlamydiales bacterium]